MNKILSNSYTEVSYILNILGDDYKSKIPSQILKCIYNNKNNNYKFNIDTNIEEANISRNALIIISIFNLKYWENDEVEKERLRKIYNINEQIFQKKINEYKNNQDVLKNVDYNDGSLNISLYIYDNYAVRNVVINVIDNKDLVLNILKYYNTKTKEYLNKMNDNDIYYYGINGYGVTDGYYSELYSEIGKFIVDNIDENIDINKNYKYITINNDYDKNIFVTNRVEELDKIMEKYVNDNDDDISDAETARVM